MGCLLWIQILIYIPLQSLHRCMQYHVILEHVIMALDCILGQVLGGLVSSISVNEQNHWILFLVVTIYQLVKENTDFLLFISAAFTQRIALKTLKMYLLTLDWFNKEMLPWNSSWMWFDNCNINLCHYLPISVIVRKWFISYIIYFISF